MQTPQDQVYPPLDSPSPSQIRGQKDDWKDLKKKRCKLPSCRELFKPKRPEQLFCTPAHRKQWHLTGEGLEARIMEKLSASLSTLRESLKRFISSEVRRVLATKLKTQSKATKKKR
jgi:hypothetical protein